MRFFTFTALILTCTLCVFTAQAEQINVRAGAHKDYSRLVFDWPKAVTYNVEKKSQGKLELSFSQAADLDTQALAKTLVANIRGLKILEQDPLRVELDVADGGRIRDFKIGNKVILDVYNPPTGARTPSKIAVETASSAPAAINKQDEKKAEIAKKIPQENKQDIVLQDAPPKQPVKQLKANEQPTIIAVSSTESFGLAAFVNAGNLWIVNDKDDILLKPQISGPRARSLPELEEQKDAGALIYSLPLPKDVELKGQGGGVLWRIMMSPDLQRNEAREPLRKNVGTEAARGGVLSWPLQGARELKEITDTATGEKLFVVTVDNPEETAGKARSFVDFDVLDSPIGLAIVPKIDDLEVRVVRGGVEISSPRGLALNSQSQVDDARRTRQHRAKMTLEQREEALKTEKIYDFSSWQLGGMKAVKENRNVIMEDLRELKDGPRLESILTLAKMFLSNGLGAEALGMLGLAQSELPDIARSSEFLSLRGAARAISGQFEDAFIDLSDPALSEFAEIQMWRSYVLAYLGDWAQASEVKPDETGAIYDYPPRLRNEIGVTLAEIRLRNGELTEAKKLLNLVEQDLKNLPDNHKAALKYLKGEAHRQAGKYDETKKYWEELSEGKDDLYRVKSALALTRLKVNQDELSTQKAIDALERLRYAWRGDELEAQVNFWLGRTYFENNDFVKGLRIMREASGLVENPGLSQRIAENMVDIFTGLFLDKEKLSGVSPLDAVAVYDQFTELLPLDEKGNAVVEGLADHLSKADMFTKAGQLLDHQLTHRLGGKESVRVGKKLAAIQLLDKDSKNALTTLNKTSMKLQELPVEEQGPEKFRELSLLRARALSLGGRPDQALALLEGLETAPDINRLRAEIAWESAYWDDAAEALGDVIIDQNISLTRPLDEENTLLLLQRAVALNLSSNRVALANLRERYADLMTQTEKAQIFEVITRPRQSTALADRDTLLSVVSEVELFSDFLKNYAEVGSLSAGSEG